MLIFVTNARSDENKYILSIRQSDFTKTIYNILWKCRGNILFSPLTIHAELSLLSQYSENSTLNTPDEITLKAYKPLMERLREGIGLQFQMANKIYLQNYIPIQEDFKQLSKENYAIEINNMVLLNSENALNKINEWVYSKTNRKIKTIIKSYDIINETRLLALNAIYFKGIWLNSFGQLATEKKKFYVCGKKFVEIDMMHQRGSFLFNYINNLEASVLLLPYAYHRMKLAILLPESPKGIHKFEKKLINYDLTTIFDNLEYYEMDIWLPKFKLGITTDLDMTKLLRNVGA